MEVSNPNDIAYPKILHSTEGQRRMRHWRIGVKIVLPILFLLSNPDAFAHLTTRGYKSSEIVQKAEIICTATVVSTQCQWNEDHRGSHIYTNVELLIGQKIKGNLPSNHFNLEVVGGTVGDITESVGYSPVFRTGEQTILFLEGEPPRLVGGIMGKIPIFNKHVFWGDRKVSLEALCDSLALGTVEVFAESDDVVFADGITGPNITSIVPDIGSAGTGTQVTIHGTGFGESEDGGAVEFFHGRPDGPPTIEASDISSWSDTQIICTVPVGTQGYHGSAGSGPVTVTTWSGASNGYPFRVTFGYNGWHWAGESPVVPYYVNENTSDCENEGAAVQAAAETWNSTGASFQFQYTAPHTNTEPSRNGYSEIMWGTAESGIVAFVLPYLWRQTAYDKDGFAVGERLIECDMVFNDRDYDWTTNPRSPDPYGQSVDVQSIALHEFGHWLNLHDLYGDIGDGEYDVGKVMYGKETALIRDLHPDDVAGIQWIYPPTNPPAIPDSIGYPSSDDDGLYIVNWTSCSEASSYQLERSTDGVNWVQVYTGPHTYFEDIVDDGNYRYRVAASNTAGTSGWQTGDWSCLVQFSIWEGSGEPNDPFLIRTAEQLDRIGTHSRWWSRHFRLIADIDLSEYDGWDGRPAFHVIAPNDESEPWTGVFDGNDHIVSNFACILSKPGHAGLFGCVAGPNAQVKHLRIIGSRVRHIDASVHNRTGSLVGLLKEGTITGCYADDARIRGKNRVSGLVGQNENGRIVNCYANANVSGTVDVGGLVGYNSGLVSGCSCEGSTTGIEYVGGLAGSNNPGGTVIQCHSSNTVRGVKTVGGLVGENLGGTVNQCYSIGPISGTEEDVGGMVGGNSGEIVASFWDIETSNQPTSSGGTGKTTAEMQTESTFTDAGWDFVDETENGTDDIWWILEGQDYPRLWWELIEE